MSNVNTIKRLGYEFRPMKADDYLGLAGVEDGSFIHYVDGDDGETILVLSADLSEVTELVTGEHDTVERTWRAVR